jgi:hypothetical protein
MSRQMHLTRLVLCLALLVSVASCTWSPVYQRSARLVPTIATNGEGSTVSAQTRSRLGDLLGDIAKRYEMVPCPTFLGRKREVSRYCTSNEGIHYMLTLHVTQLNGVFLIEIEEPDSTAFFKAKQSDRLRTIWSDLLLRLHAEWPGCVSEQGQETSEKKRVIQKIK